MAKEPLIAVSLIVFISISLTLGLFLVPKIKVSGEATLPIKISTLTSLKNVDHRTALFNNNPLTKQNFERKLIFPSQLKNIFDSKYKFYKASLPENYKGYSGDGLYLVGRGTNVTLNNNMKVVIKDAYIVKNDKYTNYAYGQINLIYDFYLGNNKLNYLPFTTSLSYGSSNYLYGTNLTLLSNAVYNSSLVNLSFHSTFSQKFFTCKDFYNLCLQKSKIKEFNCKDYCPWTTVDNEVITQINNITYIYNPQKGYDIDALNQIITSCSDLVKNSYLLSSAPSELPVRLYSDAPLGMSQYGFTSPSDYKDFAPNCIPLFAHEMTHRYTLQMVHGIGKVMEGLAQYTQYHYFNLGEDNLICGSYGWTLNNSHFKEGHSYNQCLTGWSAKCSSDISSNTLWMYNLSESETYNQYPDDYYLKEKHSYKTIDEDLETSYGWKLDKINFINKEMNVSTYSQVHHLSSNTWDNPKILSHFTTHLGEFHYDPYINLTFTIFNQFDGIILYPLSNFNLSCFNQNHCSIYSGSINGYEKYYNFSEGADNSGSIENEWFNLYNTGACFWSDFGQDNLQKYLKTQDNLIKKGGDIFYPQTIMVGIIGNVKYDQLMKKYGLDYNYYTPEPLNLVDNLDMQVGLVS